MSNWTHKLELKDLHDKFGTGDMTPKQIGEEVAKRLRKLLEVNTPAISGDLRDEGYAIADRFMDIEDVEEYDDVLTELYDWGDTPLWTPPNTPFSMQRKLCWINTM